MTKAEIADSVRAEVTTTSGVTITRVQMEEAYAPLKKMKPLNYRDFDKFHHNLESALGQKLSFEELRDAVQSICPTATFFENAEGYRWNHDGVTEIVPHAFRASGLNVAAEAAAPAVSGPAAEPSKAEPASVGDDGDELPLLRTVYAELDNHNMGFRDLDAFVAKYEAATGRSVTVADMKKKLRSVCPKVNFWDSAVGGAFVTATGVPLANAFRANELLISKVAATASVAVEPAPAASSSEKSTAIVSDLSKETMRQVYRNLEELTNQFRDLASFRSEVEKELGHEVTEADLMTTIKHLCPDVKFWKRCPYTDGRRFAAVAFKSPSLAKQTSARRLMQQFAFFPFVGKTDGFQLAINQLASKALQEKWSYGDTDDATNPILTNYLLLTFQRLVAEDEEHTGDIMWKTKIRVSADGQYAIFNTGLVDTLYEPIYALFGSNPNKDKQRWRFEMFVGSTDTRRQDIVRIFGTDLPAPAHYYNSTSELVYNIKAEIGSYNWNHFIEHCERLPLEFLRDNVDGFDFSSEPKDEKFYKSLAAHINNPANIRSLNRLKRRIEDAIDYAIKRVRWNFKTAIPIYYPGQRQISLLLPLTLCEQNERIDVALVLEATASGAYIAHTILTLQMAYTNARLITRPDSDWLMAESISAGRDDAELDD